MRRLALSLLLAACAARAQMVDHLVPFHSSQGVWEFGCRDGKIVAVRIVFIVPGEVLLQVPPDVCQAKPAAQPGSAPPGEQQRQPASAPARGWRPA